MWAPLSNEDDLDEKRRSLVDRRDEPEPIDGILISRPITALPPALSVMEPSALTSPMPSMKNP